MLGQKAQGIHGHMAHSMDGQVDMASSGNIQAYRVALSEDGNWMEWKHKSVEVEICKQMQNIASYLYILPFPYFLQCCSPLGGRITPYYFWVLFNDIGNFFFEVIFLCLSQFGIDDTILAAKKTQDDKGQHLLSRGTSECQIVFCKWKMSRE